MPAWYPLTLQSDLDMTKTSISNKPHEPRNRWRLRLARLITSCVDSTSFDEATQPSEKTALSPHVEDVNSWVDPLERSKYHAAHLSFLHTFPEYKLTATLDALRASDYTRLYRGEVYVDYMGGSLHPERLIRDHSAFLQQSVLGNTHSINNSSQLSAKCANEARDAVLSFFGAPTQEYTVIFTSNATCALKLIGESYPFSKGSSFVLGADSHNSVHGIRQFAARAGSDVVYIESTRYGGFDNELAKDILKLHRPQDSHQSLFALTGASNITNTKAPLSILEYASSMGYHTLIDAAALAPTSTISLADVKVDAMAVSFYKMFGFPTGSGALIAKKSFLAQLNRPWFAGGTVDVVQVPGSIVTMASEMHEQFEDGTINYANLPAVTSGLRFLTKYIAFLPLRLSCLMHYLITSLSSLRYERTGKPVIRIASRIPTRRLKYVGEQSDTGSTLSFIFLSPEGEMLPLSFIEYAAARSNISLRTGCMCNPGGAAAILGVEDEMQNLYQGVTRETFECMVGRELGVVRISLGLASNFYDAWRVVKFAEEVIGCEKAMRDIFDEWEFGRLEQERMKGDHPTIPTVGILDWRLMTFTLKTREAE